MAGIFAAFTSELPATVKKRQLYDCKQRERLYQTIIEKANEVIELKEELIKLREQSKEPPKNTKIKRRSNEPATINMRNQLEIAKEELNELFFKLVKHRKKFKNVGHSTDRMSIQAIYVKVMRDYREGGDEAYDDDMYSMDAIKERHKQNIIARQKRRSQILDDQARDTTRKELLKLLKEAQDDIDAGNRRKIKNRRRSLALNPPGTNRTNLHYLKF